MLCARENEVLLWARDPEVVESINREHRNPRYLSEAALPTALRATRDLAETLAAAELVICAVPSHSVREVMSQAAPWLVGDPIVVSTVKGIELDTGMTMHQVLEGPSFAAEIAQRLPTVVTLACREEAYAISVQSTLSCPWFRCYSSTDVIGVEMGGALKNVIAIAIGIGDGQRMGHNSRAALMTRGLAEITRLGTRAGAKPSTFLGLSGMGDLLLTCTGDLSRNRRLGLALGEGRSLDKTLHAMDGVVEGVETTRAACQLAERLGVELPISNMVRQVIDGERTPREAGEALMTRQLRSEQD
jgi:glycerol-3-phosphate dehydrogenase (NAD(P)+)